MKLLLLLLCFQTTPDTSGLPEFAVDKIPEIKAARLPATALQTPLAVSKLTAVDILQARPKTSLFDPLTLIPGVFALNAENYAQDLRLSVRGFGARAAFGIRGIQLVVDGIPESTPDGQAEVDNIDPAALQGLELLRSPSAGLYGNAAGGVLLLETALPDSSFEMSAQALGGTYGLRRYQIQSGVRKGRWATQGTLSSQQLTGYRDHAAMRSTQVTLKSVFKPNDRTQLTLLLSGVDSPKAEDPGGLTAEQVAEDPQQARAQSLTFQTGESVRHGRAGLLFQKQQGRLDWGGRLFGALRRLDNSLPFTAAGQVALQRAFGGSGIFVGYKSPVAGGVWNAQAGVDAEKQADNRTRYDNLQGKRGLPALNQLENYDRIGAWVVQQWTHSRLRIMGSLRADLIRIHAQDRLLSDGDQSGSRNFHRLSPMLGLLWQPGNTQSWYFNCSDNFETPTLNELSNNPASTGGFSDLRPQRSRNVEIGFKQAANQFLQAEAALFHIRLRDEIVPYQLPEIPGRNFFRNAGRSQRNGLELGIRVFPARNWSLHTSYTWSDFRYRDYTANGTSFDHKLLPGIPRHHAQGELRFKRKGLFLAFQTRYIGRLYVNDANSEAAPAYWLCHLRGAWILSANHWQIEPSFGIQNLLNQHYYSNILINAAAERYYEPGVARNVWVGLKWSIGH